MIRKHVFKRPMLLAGLAHENAICLLHNLRLDDSRPVPEVHHAGLTPNHGFLCFSIAARTERKSSSRNASRHWNSLPTFEKLTGCPRRPRKFTLRQDRIDVSSKGPCGTR